MPGNRGIFTLAQSVRLGAWPGICMPTSRLLRYSSDSSVLGPVADRRIIQSTVDCTSADILSYPPNSEYPPIPAYY